MAMALAFGVSTQAVGQSGATEDLQALIEQAESVPLDQDCALALTGEPAEPFKDHEAQRGPNALPFFFLLAGYALTPEPGNSDARTRWLPDISNGGNGMRALCGSARIYTPQGDAITENPSVYTALRLTHRAILIPELRADLAEDVWRERHRRMKSNDVLFVDVAGLSTDAVFELVQDLEFKAPGDFAVKIGDTLIIPADDLQIRAPE